MTRTLGSRYRLSEFLASGETGEVWRALDLGTARQVAVKLIYPRLAEDTRLVDRFMRARSELTALWHPNIARVLDIVVDEHDLALVTDLVPGTDLARRLAQSGPFRPAAASAVAEAVADALSAAHRVGVVHGDVKPSNVVVPSPSDGPARVTDFSVALLVRAGGRHGDPSVPSRYRAPEVTEGAVPAPPSDVYALGIVLAESLVGDPARLRQLLDGPAVNPLARLGQVAEACVEGDLSFRPSAAEVHKELRQLTPVLTALEGAEPTSRSARWNGPSGGRPTLTERPAGQGGPRHAGHPTETNGKVRGAVGGAPEPPERQRPLRLVVALVVAVAIVLGALTVTRAFWGLPGEAKTSPSPPVHTSASEGSEPTAADPTLPTAATAHTHEGGTAFVRYWFAALTHAQRTGDTTYLASSINPACEACQTAIKAIRATYGAGGSLRDGEYLVRRVSTNPLWSLEKPIYEATLDRSPRRVVDRTGAEKQDLARLTFAVCVLVLEWHDNRWRVLEVADTGCVG